MSVRWTLLLLLAAVCAVSSVPVARGVTAGEAEVQKCEDRIATVRREILNRYEDSLSELQASFQKAADLEGALAVRAERQRAAKEGALTEAAIVPEPRALRTVQTQTLVKLQELITQVVSETLPRLIELKRTLTMAGKLDEALVMRSAIERLQAEHLPLVRPDPAVPIAAETLLQAYTADRTRADKTYKGQRVAVRGVVAGFRSDPDGKQYSIYLSGGAAGGWVLCGFSTADYRIREETQFNTTFLVIAGKEGSGTGIKLQKGQPYEIRGTCEGWDEAVRLSKCELAR